MAHTVTVLLYTSTVVVWKERSSVCLMFCTVRLSLVIVIHRVLHSVKTQRYGEFSFRIFLKVLIALSLLPVFVMNFYSNLLKK